MMKKKLRDNLFRVVLSVAGLSLLIVFVLNISETEIEAGPHGETGRIEKLIVSEGRAVMNVELTSLRGTARGKRDNNGEVRFDLETNSFFTILTFNDELRGALPSAVGITADNKSAGDALFNSAKDVVIENLPPGAEHELVVRDRESGTIFFNIEGAEIDYDPASRSFKILSGRLAVTPEYGRLIGVRAGTIAGTISMNATMRPIEVTMVDNGAVTSNSLPPMGDQAGTVPGPDVIVGDVRGLAQFGSASNGQVGLAVGTDSCNFGTENLNWFALPSNDHPVIPQNMYRMSGGSSNQERFEQIGQSNVKHAFTALTQNLCDLGCNGVGGSRLGSGCSDPYSASLNAGPSLGSRAWINPFNGFFPRGDSSTPPNSHGGHSHSGPSHRILINIPDLDQSANQGATYYAEAQYITPHEYNWCQANPTQCNMYNNVSYRKYNVSGNSSPFSFSPAEATQRMKTAISAWPGASFVEIHPAPGIDGVGTVAYKVTETSPGVWHYEYAIYNQNLDRAIGSFSVAKGSGATLSNIGFHAPPQHPGWTNDGTENSLGFSSSPWTVSQTADSIGWSTEAFAANANANAIRWGTMYNFRFDSTAAPTLQNATVGFFKTGEPIVIQVLAPGGSVVENASVSGRVTNQAGVGLRNVRVSITGDGGTRTAITSSFGYYRFENVATGETYTVSAAGKGNTFTPQEITVTDNVTGLNFVAN